LQTWVEPGKCGANNRPTQNLISGCGMASERSTFDLTPGAGNDVSLGGGSTVPSLDNRFDHCPLEWTGSESIEDNTDLYNSFTASLPAAALFRARQTTIVVRGSYFVADPPPPGEPYNPLKGETSVHWTVTFTRIAHKQFPLPVAQ
jgi:hypothetical protein